jgi:hypothetical protein
MKTMKLTTALKNSKEGKFEFIFDAKLGINEIRLNSGKIIFIEIR